MTSQTAVPPDGGWGWVFVAGCALQWFFNGGLIRSFSLIYEQMLIRFGASASATAAVYSFNIASSMLTAPLSAALSTRVTPRQGALIGTTLMFTGMLATAFAPNIVVVYFTYGIMAGTGSGMIATMRFISTPLWFRKNLGRAVSLILMTDGLGVMAISPLLDFMFSYYGYTGTMMFAASLTLHGLVVAAVMGPLPSPSQQKPKSEVKDECIIKQDEELDGKSPNLSRSLTHSSSSSGDEKDELAVSFEAGRRRSSTSRSNCSISRSNTKISTKVDVTEQLASCELTPGNHTSSYASSEDIDKNYEIEASYTVANNLNNLKNDCEAVQNGSHELITKIEDDGPLKLQNGSHNESEQITDDTSSDCSGCLSKFYSYLDIRLLRSSTFFTFALLMTSSSLCASMSNTHLVGIASDRSVASHQVAILLTIIGGLAVVTKLSSGFIFDLRCFKPVRTPVFGAMGVVCGLLLIFIPVTSGAPMFAILWILNQINMSALNTQESVILNELVPRKRYASAIGLSRFFRGLGVMVGPTVGGLLRDRTGNYNATLYFGGSIFLLAATLFELNTLRRHLGLCKRTLKT